MIRMTCDGDIPGYWLVTSGRVECHLPGGTGTARLSDARWPEKGKLL